MRIYLVSDLHVEYFHNFPLPHPQSDIDVVVLAGDIHKGDKVLDVAVAYQRHCKVPVIVVAGNHEFDGSEYTSRLEALKRESALLENVYFLENESVVIDGARFLGCTLWTDFSLNGVHKKKESKSAAVRAISDFDVIRYQGGRFTVEHVEALFHASYAWLEGELAKEFAGATVVITHFLPHRAGIHPMHLETPKDHVTAYFTADCSDLMRRFPVTAWLYGHTHNSVDIEVEDGVRLVSNQRGYPKEPWYITEFDSGKIVDTGHDGSQNRTLQLEAAERKYNRRVMLTSGDWMPAPDIVRAAKPRANAVKAAFPRWVDEGKLFSIRHRGETLYPRYAFDVNAMHEPLAELEEIIRAFGGPDNGWELAAWFDTPNSDLGLSLPKYCLATRPKAVVFAAKEGGGTSRRWTTLRSRP